MGATGSSLSDPAADPRVARRVKTLSEFVSDIAKANKLALELADALPFPPLSFDLQVARAAISDMLPIIWRFGRNIRVVVSSGDESRVLNIRQFLFVLLCFEDLKAYSQLFHTVSQIKHDVHGDTKDESECSVCMERDVDLVLPCTHSFCSGCYSDWKARDMTCPMCRAKQRVQEDEWVLTSEEEAVLPSVQRAPDAVRLAAFLHSIPIVRSEPPTLSHAPVSPPTHYARATVVPPPPLEGTPLEVPTFAPAAAGDDAPVAPFPVPSAYYPAPPPPAAAPPPYCPPPAYRAAATAVPPPLLSHTVGPGYAAAATAPAVVQATTQHQDTLLVGTSTSEPRLRVGSQQQQQAPPTVHPTLQRNWSH